MEISKEEVQMLITALGVVDLNYRLNDQERVLYNKLLAFIKKCKYYPEKDSRPSV